MALVAIGRALGIDRAKQKVATDKIINIMEDCKATDNFNARKGEHIDHLSVAGDMAKLVLDRFV